MRTAHGDRLRCALRGFARDRSGSVATIFAVAIVPVIIAAGVGFDLSRAMSGRAHLQDAVDSTALALAHMPAGTDQATLQAKAQSWMAANLRDDALGPVNLSVTPGTGQVVIDASSYVSTSLTAIAGFAQMSISAHSTVKWGTGHVEVVLVLDNTGSMASNRKLTNLISAAKSLVSTLLAANTASDPDAVKIAIVPFSNTVNIGSGYQASGVTGGWLDPSAKAYAGQDTDIFSTDTYGGAPVNRFNLFSNLGVTWGGCVETRPQWVNGVDKSYDITDTVPDASKPGAQFVPYFAPDEPDDDGYTNDYIYDGPSPKSNGWSDRQANINKYYYKCKTTHHGQCTSYKSGVSSPTWSNTGGTGMGTGYDYGPNFGCGIAPVQRLTNSASTLTSLLDKMVAAGDTNVPMGLFWGWMALSPNLPFGDGVAYGTNGVTKVVIVLTDGANSSTYGNWTNGQDHSYYSGFGYQWQHLISKNNGSFSSPSDALDDREAKICANMKDASRKIVIYSVAVEVTDSTAKSLLQSCATKPEFYIDATSSDQLQAAFANIAGSIGNLRIAQ